LKSYAVLENLSLSVGVGVTAFSASGQTLFSSSVCASTAGFLSELEAILNYGDAEHVALLHGCYQARRFGGQYVFLAPSGLAYCASPLAMEKGEMIAGVVAGPFLMVDSHEYMEMDILSRRRLGERAMGTLENYLKNVPFILPARARAISELLFVCASGLSAAKETAAAPPAGSPVAAYPIAKEDELLAAISIGDVHAAGALLNDILGQVLFHSSGDLEILRSRVVELTVLLSRAALRGGANIDAIFGLNYSFLREIDALDARDDIIQWLHGVTRRFAQHVFDYAQAKHVDVIYRAIAYIKQNYHNRITLQDVADHVFLSLSYFSKVFKEETGQAPGAFLTAIRIDAAKKRLRDPAVSIVEIPVLVGFESQSYFTRVFKKTTGCTPGRFRQQSWEKGWGGQNEGRMRR